MKQKRSNTTTTITKTKERENLVGQRFAYLLVIGPAVRPSHVKTGTYYRCVCLRCGKYTTVQASCLKRGDTKSCGCLRKAYTAYMRAGIPYDKNVHRGPTEEVHHG